ncbi:MAG: hypothetical protein NTX65_02085 [Ignavibacteriales bacterium]|nr:hypothetical protein [Ignavibacteriales bacterium]
MKNFADNYLLIHFVYYILRATNNYNTIAAPFEAVGLEELVMR